MQSFLKNNQQLITRNGEKKEEEIDGYMLWLNAPLWCSWHTGKKKRNVVMSSELTAVNNTEQNWADSRLFKAHLVHQMLEMTDHIVHLVTD